MIGRHAHRTGAAPVSVMTGTCVDLIETARNSSEGMMSMHTSLHDYEMPSRSGELASGAARPRRDGNGVELALL